MSEFKRPKVNNEHRTNPYDHGYHDGYNGAEYLPPLAGDLCDDYARGYDDGATDAELDKDDYLFMEGNNGF